MVYLAWADAFHTTVFLRGRVAIVLTIESLANLATASARLLRAECIETRSAAVVGEFLAFVSHRIVGPTEYGATCALISVWSSRARI